jgi:tetratricopeptide (TPR) repeat protein
LARISAMQSAPVDDNAEARSLQIPARPFMLLIALLITAAFGFSRTVWRISITGEAYTLHLLFILAIFSVFYANWKTNPRLQHLGFFLVGLGAANHVTLLIYAPILLIPILIHRLRAPSHRFRTLAFYALFLLLGLSCYLYLPLRAARDPLFNWGNPDTLGRFFAHITGRQYEFKTLSVPFSLFPFRAAKLATEVARETNWLFWLLALAGLPFFPWRALRIWCPWAALLIVNSFFFIKYGEWVPHLFLPSYLALWVLGAVSIFSLAQKMASVLPARRARLLSGTLLTTAIVVLLVLLPFLQFARNDYLLAQSRNKLPAVLARKILEPIPFGSLLILEDGNSVNSALCAQYLDHFRDDITIIDPFGSYYSQALHKGFDEMRPAWRGALPYRLRNRTPPPDFRQVLLQFLDRRKPAQKVFADATFLLSSDIPVSQVVPLGMVFELAPSGETQTVLKSVWRKDAEQQFAYFRQLMTNDRILLRDDQTREAIFAHVNNVALLFSRAGLRPEALTQWHRILSLDPSNRDALLNLAVVLDEDGASSRALEHFTRARALYPDDPLVHFQLAIFHVRHHEPRAALGEFRAASELDPLDTTALFNYAVLLAQSGQKTESIATLREVLRLNPQDTRAQRLLDALSP